VLPAAVVDAFTDVPFAGNPAGLVLLGSATAAKPAWMQAVARELGVSETAFLVARESGEYGLRWFTPAVEMELCGHATLAAAHWLWERGETDAEQIRFATRGGTLTARRADRGYITLDFPVVPVVDRAEPPGWEGAFPGADLRWVGRTGGSGELERNALFVTDAATLRALRPDFARVAALPCGGAIVTAESDAPGYDVLTRYFAPACGVDEDPVTGSAHCTVGWHWAPTLGPRLVARQASQRGGDLLVELRGGRVLLTGAAVTVATLDLLV
jgi:predicted PhzF superfamily epimerase YddE/YHI9